MIKTNSNKITFGGTCGKDLDIKGGTNGNKPFGIISVAQTTAWKKQDGTGFNERTTWMNLKFNDYILQKIQRNGGLFKGDEIAIDGYLVQRSIGEQNHMITEIQVTDILSHMPKALKELAKQSGMNQPSQPQNAPQNNAPHQPAYQQNAPQNNAPHQPAYQQNAPHQAAPNQEWTNDFYGSKQQ